VLQNAPETQTAYLLAIAFDLLPEGLRQQAADNLVHLVNEAGGHLRTGFLGTPYVVSVLDSLGYSDLATEMLFKDTYPSWFYSIDQGATTMWERWDSYTNENGFNPEGMNSFNHYAYGAIGQWMYERLAGLAPDPENPGYKHFFIRPLIVEQLDWVQAELETPYGLIGSSWKKDNGNLILEATVPPNSSATIEFPSGKEAQIITSGRHQFTLDWNM
jgi:alpha-L-rhamnosidase